MSVSRVFTAGARVAGWRCAIPAAAGRVQPQSYFCTSSSSASGAGKAADDDEVAPRRRASMHYDRRESALAAVRELGHADLGSALADMELPGERLSTIPPEAADEVGASYWRETDPQFEQLYSQMPRMQAAAGEAGVEQSSDWAAHNKAVRSMPLWMLFHYARQEFDEDDVDRHSLQKPKLAPTLIRKSTANTYGNASGTGRRKTASARVQLRVGAGQVTVNGVPLAYYFSSMEDRKRALFPLQLLEATGAFDVRVAVRGGGMSGQAGAVQHGIAQALAAYDPYLKSTLKKFGLLRRDPRMVERKKPGQAKARKKFTWVKR